ncbi:MAG: NAD(P)/FAD-dependent oxidoreductase [Paracoccaceae bacterium]
MSNPSSKVVLIGAGPAGLTTAYALTEQERDYSIEVFEGSSQVGGISRTESFNGFRFDIGGHRFFTKVEPVEKMWHDVLGDEFIEVQRMSRIYFRGRFFNYPLQFFNALSNIGLYEATRIILSYGKWRMMPHRSENTFEEWVMNRFGGRLYMHFFKSYTHKVWGIPPQQIQADWAAQRIKNLSLFKAVWNAVSGANDTTSLIERFRYPRLGPGQMWEAVTRIVEERGGKVTMNAWVERVRRDGDRVGGVDVVEETPEGERRRSVEADHVVNSMPLRELIEAFDPPPPEPVVEAAGRLRYRDFLIVTLVLDDPDPFPDNWVYVHDPDVMVGRIQNFRAWSKDMLPNETQASIGMEYFCHVGDGLWTMSDEDLRAMAARELEQLKLAPADKVVGSKVIRQPKAYPVYDTEYREALATVSEWLKSLKGFQTVGRNGLHRYNNQDHSMLTGMLAARNIAGEDHDIWEVNVERSYHEEFERPRQDRKGRVAEAA